jgi:hypothetical protein
MFLIIRIKTRHQKINKNAAIKSATPEVIFRIVSAKQSSIVVWSALKKTE